MLKKSNLKGIMLTLVLLSLVIPANAFARDLTKFVPADSSGIISITLKNLWGTGVIEEMIKEDGEVTLQEIKQKTGIDLKKQLEGMAVVLPGKNNSAGTNDEPVLVVFADIPQLELIKLITFKDENETKIESKVIDGYEMMVIDAKNESTKYLYFHDSSTLIFSENKPWLMSVLGTVTGKTPGMSSNKNLMAEYKKADKNHDLWGVINVPPMDKDEAQGNPMAATLSNINTVYLGASYNGDIAKYQINLFSNNKDKIAQLFNSINGFKMMMQGMVVQESPEAGPILEKMKIEQTADSVKIHGNVTRAEIEALKAAEEKKKQENETSE